MRWTIWICCAGLAFAQGTEPKPKPEDYVVHGQAGNIAVGAEFMVHSFSGQGQTYVVKDYLVVEVALFPPKGESVEASPGKFALRFNGKKQVLTPQAPSMVAASLQHPEWNPAPRLEAGAGLGDAGVILGRPASRTPFPGAPPPPETRGPKPPRAPDADHGVEPEVRVKPEELVVAAALPEGAHRGPISGYLYFGYKGKTSSIKSLELLYGDAVLKLR